MASSLPHFPPFDINTDPTGVGVTWKKWVHRFDDFLVAFNTDDERRQKGLPLYHGGKELHDIYDTLSSAKDDYRNYPNLVRTQFQKISGSDY